MDRYAPLMQENKEIRLLVLEAAATSTSQITCSLHIASLDEDPAYEALSYVWGNASNPKTILLAEQEHQVTPNVFDALTALRYHDRPRTL
jgi:hypothetical protein